MSGGDGPRVDVRVSDADRDRAAEALQAHHASGRLTLDELTQRIEETFRARSLSDLDHALRELPAERAVASTPRRRWRHQRLPGWWVRVNGICTAVWAATTVGSGPHYFWPMWVMLGTGIPVVASAGQGRRKQADPGGRSAVPPQVTPTETGIGRVVTSVLFVDIVDSTTHAATMGDARWNTLLSDFERQVRAEITGIGGREVFTKGDEVVSAFPTPAAAVRCGLVLRTRAQTLGLDVRAGVHAGEVDQQGHELRGLAMHIGARVCAVARPGELLVSSTVRDLLIGSRMSFVDAGQHELKGVPGRWQLYSVTD